jgi:WD40 repeat protein
MQPVVVASSEGHAHFILSVAYSSDSHMIASGGADDVVRLWDADTGKLLGELIGHSDYVQAVVFSPVDQNVLVSGGRDGKLFMWSICERKRMNISFNGHDAAVRSVSFNSDGNFLASGSGAQTSSETQDNTVRIWSVSAGTQVIHLRFHTSAVLAVQWHPRHPIIASAGRDRNVGLHTVAADNTTIASSMVLRGHTDYVNAVAWSPCGSVLATASSDRSIRIWHSTSGETVQVRSTIFKSSRTRI